MRRVTLLLIALLALTPAAGADDEVPARFDRFFIDATMRVDYVHLGNADEEVLTLDRVYRQGSWAGSRATLIDPFDRGAYAVKVYDLASGELLYARGFSSYFAEYRLTSAAQAGARRAFHESALIPFPRAKIRFALEVRVRDTSLHEVFSTEIDPDDLTIITEPPRGDVIVVDASVAGDPHTKVDVAFLGEGYAADEVETFREDLARAVDILFSQQPYAAMRSSFNVRGVLRPSLESGCDEPTHGAFRNTALAATFYSLGSERYLLTEDNRAVRDVAAHVPYDVLVIMVNHTRYGGGGIYNLFCTFTARNQWSPYLLLHELGHSFAGLADEYYTSSVAYNEFYPTGIEPVEPNITALLDPARLKWSALVTDGTAVPTPWEKEAYDAKDLAYQRVRQEVNEAVARAAREGRPEAEIARLERQAEELSKEHAEAMGAFLSRSAFVNQVGAFEGAGYAAEGLYRPALDCLMFTKGAKPYCPVCERAVEEVIRSYEE